MDDPKSRRSTWTTGRPFAVTVFSLIFLLGCLAVWSTRANISGAVIGSGTIEVSTSMTAVQHPIGGVVSEIYVRNGDRVRAGDILVRLDSRQFHSDLNVVEGELFEVLANIARLQAIMDNQRQMVLTPVLDEAAKARAEVKLMVERQQRQLAAHFEAITSGMHLLDEQITQVRAEIAGVEAQLLAKQDEMRLLSLEIVNAEQLAERKLITMSELYKLKKDDVTIRGDIGKNEAKIAELRGKISELNLKRLVVIPNAQEKAEEELRKLRPLRTRFMEMRLSLLDDLSKLEIRAPVNGKIHETQVQGRRSVITAAKPLMMIVPDDDPFQIGVRIAAADIDQVFIGQEASIKFRAFNARDLPIILGAVSRISPDVTLDPLTKKYHYDVKVALNAGEEAKLNGRALMPGMPVEAYIATESRTAINYVVRPIKHFFDRALRDT
ncbi:HlyD family type I secretion periplasmic adaptor subunit [Ruegeria pomeroyi]|uniref:Membrane fusion protein (MFP) family protein n=1 Tax=Ruegeria pomeroyi TaxID=89184 RepID=A0A9Q3WGQ0_9RHOB|nr:HlyD family type I secretion periplasmic adaptor subunit [Ruegeria pomeroyi]MCE8536045.1 HlyD family type I secretion periplasmic adaptor subunit [Ruegeria pomeroyi]